MRFHGALFGLKFWGFTLITNLKKKSPSKRTKRGDTTDFTALNVARSVSEMFPPDSAAIASFSGLHMKKTKDIIPRRRNEPPSRAPSDANIPSRPDPPLAGRTPSLLNISTDFSTSAVLKRYLSPQKLSSEVPSLLSPPCTTCKLSFAVSAQSVCLHTGRDIAPPLVLSFPLLPRDVLPIPVFPVKPRVSLPLERRTRKAKNS
mmetsp:Transcript_54637/g.106888  ORF Transcript_54637/g.106888 Transcript_54637/m.106888 type:complete len:203 (-) Transcript_54637:150-758(-)